MSKLLKFSPLLIGVVALICFLIFINLPEQVKAKSKSGTNFTPVAVDMAKLVEFPITVEALGTAIANESINVSVQRQQTITKILFEDGNIVSQGQTLVELNNKAELARLNELNINLTEAKRQLQRVKDLAKKSVASEQLLDEQESLVQSIIAQREVAKANLEELVVKAPFSGRLGNRQVSLGSLVRPGDTITTLDDLSIMKVDFSISELHLSSIQKGQIIRASSIAYPGEEFNGKISNIDSRIDPITRSIQVRAQITNPELKLRPGMLLQITLEKRVLNALVVPESAIVPEGDAQFVFVVNEENKAIKTQVVLGERKPGLVQILSGLSDGDNVITQGTLRVRDGSSVKIVNSQTTPADNTIGAM